VAVVKKAPAVAAPAAAVSDDSDSDAPMPPVKSTKPVAVKAAAKVAAVAESSSDDDELPPVKPAAKVAAKVTPKVTEPEEEEEEQEAVEAPLAHKKRKLDESAVTPAKKLKSSAPSTPAASGSESNEIFVGGLSFEVDEAGVRELFTECGEITSIRMPVFEDSGRFRGMAFIQFSEADAVEKAIALDGMSHLNRYLKISVSNGKPQGSAKKSFGLSEKPEGCLQCFLGNLSFTATDEDLYAAFGACGNVVSARVITDPETGESRGFGYVEFDSTEATDEAVKLTDTLIAGRAVRVDFAKAREPKVGGGRGGGFRGDRGGGGRGRGRGGDRGGGRGRGRGGGDRGRGGAQRKEGIKEFQGTKKSFD